MATDTRLRPWIRFGFAVALSTACTAKAPQYGSMPDAVVIRVDRVVVAGTRSALGERWDGPVVERGPDPICSLTALGAGYSEPVLGVGTSILCGTPGTQRPERNAEDPDLQLRLSAGSGAHFETFVEKDSLDFTFDYEFVVPVAAVPPDGLRLEVLDADDGGNAETIGLARVTVAGLRDLLSAPSGTRDLGAGPVQRLEVHAAPYVPMKVPRAVQAARAAPRAAGVRPLLAGEVVSLVADGAYTGVSSRAAKIGPTGYPLGEALQFNFEQPPFDQSPHACAIALIGRDGLFQGVPVTPAIEFLAAYGGPLRVGVNDRYPGNNDGWIAFAGRTRAPSAREWTAMKVGK